MLLVDDYALGRKICARLLRAEFRVTEAGTGEDALLALRRTEFTAVLTDYRMPAMTGVELLERIRVQDPHMRRVLMSSTQVLGLDAWIASGLVHAFIAKPFELAPAALLLRGP